MKPTLLIHGLFGSLNDRDTLEAFGEADVLAPDLLGYGDHRDHETSSLTLADQADHVISVMSKLQTPVHLVGHSVGGAVAVLVATKAPELVASLTSIEGNFTSADAFWSAEIAVKPDGEVQDIIAGYRADPESWMADGGVAASPKTTELGTAWLDNQPASTIKAQAGAVVAATGEAGYLAAVRALLDSDMPFHLLAGERSAEDWGVPDWVRKAATSDEVILGVGHLMMAEDPALFANAVLRVQR